MRYMWRYLLILVAVLALWNTIIIKPLKIFTVFLHELGHAVMAFVFGNGISGFKVGLNEGGYTLVQSKGWFSSFMIVNGGYLGSVLFALLILYLGRTAVKNFVLGSAALIFLFVSIKFYSDIETLILAVFFACIILLIYMLRNENVTEWAINIVGIACVAYAIYDIFIDTILLQLNIHLRLIAGWRGQQPLTDAVQLARMTGIPAIVWGIIWLFIALFAVNSVLLKGSGSSRSRR